MADQTFAFLLDAPQGAAPSTVQIAKLGDSFKDPRYDEFAITVADVADWAKNLEKLPGGMALIDEDHLADKPGPARRTEASGWIKGVRLEDGVPLAEVEWTPKGRQAIEEKRYLFFSPVFGPYTDETGTTHSNVLTGGALTNKPFLNMPTISLSQAPFDQRMLTTLDATASSEAPSEPSDSRRQMSTQATDFKQLAAALGIDESADEPKLLEAIKDLKEKATAKPVEATADEPVKTLEQLAADDGKVLLDKTAVAALNSAASKVPTLEAKVKTLADAAHEANFKAAWDTAVEKLLAAPAEEEAVRELYDANPDATVKMLEARSPIANATPKGSGMTDEDEVPAGVNPGSFKLDKQVRSYMLDKSEPDYIKALEAVQRINSVAGGA